MVKILRVRRWKAAIYEHEDILEACVFGIPDERLGEILCAAIYLREGVDTYPLMKAPVIPLYAGLLLLKFPLIFNFMSVSLPRVGSGKFDKPNLREHYLENL